MQLHMRLALLALLVCCTASKPVQPTFDPPIECSSPAPACPGPECPTEVDASANVCRPYDNDLSGYVECGGWTIYRWGNQDAVYIEYFKDNVFVARVFAMPAFRCESGPASFAPVWCLGEDWAKPASCP